MCSTAPIAVSICGIAGSIWIYLATSVGMLALMLSLAEMASMYVALYIVLCNSLAHISSGCLHRVRNITGKDMHIILSASMFTACSRVSEFGPRRISKFLSFLVGECCQIHPMRCVVVSDLLSHRLGLRAWLAMHHGALRIRSSAAIR